MVPRRTVRGVSIVVGVLALLVGLYVVGKREKRYHAEATVAITPVVTAKPAVAVEALAGGDVVATFAEVFSGSEVVRPALLAAKIEGPDRGATRVSAEPIPNSTVIRIEATAPSKAVAERAATAVAAAKPRVEGLSAVYEPHLVRRGAGTGEKTGTSTTVLRLEALIVAVVIALLTAALVRRIPSAEPPVAPAGEGAAQP
ncbi:MAG: hypothetical protein QOK40_2775 [Miltoncostaeaceae bacterium]|nr:hypothetical protein [Miltoncostaeaceae bacterium]